MQFKGSKRDYDGHYTTDFVDWLEYRIESLEQEIRNLKQFAHHRNIPPVGTRIAVPVLLDELPASVTIHKTLERPMLTIIPLAESPFFVLSPWGNGAGIIGFLQEFDNSFDVFEVEVVESNPRSVEVVPV